MLSPRQLLIHRDYVKLNLDEAIAAGNRRSARHLSVTLKQSIRHLRTAHALPFRCGGPMIIADSADAQLLLQRR
jgi:hypothetical protein